MDDNYYHDDDANYVGEYEEVDYVNDYEEVPPPELDEALVVTEEAYTSPTWTAGRR